MKNWYSISSKVVIKQLLSDEHYGLKNHTVENLRELYGENIIKVPILRGIGKLLLGEIGTLWSFVLMLNCIAMMMLGEVVAFAIVSSLYIICLAVFFIIEYNKENKIKALNKLNNYKVNVIRDGIDETIPVEELVVGDIVFIEEGKYVPADIRIIESKGLFVNELAVTGVDYEVEKYSAKQDNKIDDISSIRNMIFKSTVVTKGSGIGIVVATGMNTQIGNLVKVLSTEESHSSDIVNRLKNFMNKFAGVGIACEGIVAFIQLLFRASREEYIKGAVAVLTITSPVGVSLGILFFLWLFAVLLKKKGIYFKNISSTYILSKINLIFTDKMGMISNESMQLTRVYCNNKLYVVSTGEVITGVEEGKKNISVDVDIHKDRSLNRLFKSAVLCNDSVYSNSDESNIGDPKEISILKFTHSNLMFKNEVNSESERVLDVPYNNDKRTKTVINKIDKYYRAHSMAAVDEILERCTHILKNGIETMMNDNDIEEIKKTVYNLSIKGLHTCAVAYRTFNYLPSADENIESNMVFIGILGMSNPLKQDSFHNIKSLNQNKVRVVLSCEENKAAATTIGKNLELINTGSAISGMELQYLSKEEINNIAKGCSVYSQVNSKQKSHIVEALKEFGYKIASVGWKLTDISYLTNSHISIGVGENCSGIVKTVSDINMDEGSIGKLEELITDSKKLECSMLNSVSYFVTLCSSLLGYCLLGLVFTGNLPLNIYNILWISGFNGIVLSTLLIFRYRSIEDIEYYERIRNEDLLQSMDINWSVFRGVAAALISFGGVLTANLLHIDTGIPLGFTILCISSILIVTDFSKGLLLFSDIKSNLIMLFTILFLLVLIKLDDLYNAMNFSHMGTLEYEIIAIGAILIYLVIIIKKKIKK